MKSLVHQFRHYWNNENQLIEARSSFFDKGVVKREILTDALAFSWLRTQYKNVPTSILPLFEDTKALRVIGLKLNKWISEASEIWIGCFDKTGSLVSYYASTRLPQDWGLIKFNDSDIGYNGISQAMELGDDAIVIGYEHYSDALCQHVSIGLVDETGVYGIILPLSQCDETILSEVTHGLMRRIFADVLNNLLITRPLIYFFDAQTTVFNECFKRYQDIAARYAMLQIEYSGNLSSSVINGFLQLQENRYKKYVYICKEMPDSYEALTRGLKAEDTMVVLENLGAFSEEFQEKVLREFSSKLIYSKSKEVVTERGIKVLILYKENEKYLTCFPTILSELQVILTKVNLRVPRFNEIGTQFKSYLYNEFQNIATKHSKQLFSLGEEALSTLTAYNWPGEYHELELVVEKMIKTFPVEGKVPLSAVPDYILRAYDVQKNCVSLKEKEKVWIQETVERCHWNMKKTAEELDITRSTLYKKIEQYGIKR